MLSYFILYTQSFNVFLSPIGGNFTHFHSFVLLDTLSQNVWSCSIKSEEIQIWDLLDVAQNVKKGVQNYWNFFFHADAQDVAYQVQKCAQIDKKQIFLFELEVIGGLLIGDLRDALKTGPLAHQIWGSSSSWKHKIM